MATEIFTGLEIVNGSEEVIQRIGETTLDIDCTTTSKAEAQALGIRFSDTDTPFPDYLRDVINKSNGWTINANGWYPTTKPADSIGLLIPLDRGYNWEFEIKYLYYATSTNQFGRIVFGAYSTTGFSLMHLLCYDFSSAFYQLHRFPQLSNGGGGYVNLGNDVANRPNNQIHTTKIRNYNGCWQFLKPLDVGWQTYTGRAGTKPLTPDALFIQFFAFAASPYWASKLRNIKVTYLK